MESGMGGWTETLEANREIQAKCDELRHEVEGLLNKKFEVFRAVQYRCQLVHGMNYVIKVYVGHTDFLHVSMFEPLPCDNEKLKLIDAVEKKGNDPILPF